MIRFLLCIVCLFSQIWAIYPEYQEYFNQELEQGDGEYRCFADKIDKTKVKSIFEIGSRNAKDAVELSNYYHCHVFAFECHPESIELCKKTIGLNPNITLVPFGIWDENGERDFYMRICDDNSGASSFFKVPDKKFEELYKKVTVKTVRLDEFLKANAIKNIDLLCMDVEGAAFQVLRGLDDELKKVKYIITELEHITVYSGEILFEEVDAYLKKFGFRRTEDPFLFPNRMTGRTEDFLYINSSDDYTEVSSRIGFWRD